MSIEHIGQRVAILMDVQNLYHSAKHLYRSRINFQEIIKTAVGSRTLIRAFAYVIRTKTGEEKSFFDALDKLGIEMRVKDLQEFPGGMKKGDWDVGIAIDAVRIEPTVDVVVLVSGDGDFVPLIEYLRNRGKRIEVISFGRSSSARLKEQTDLFIDLDNQTKKHLIRIRKKKQLKEILVFKQMDQLNKLTKV